MKDRACANARLLPQSSVAQPLIEFSTLPQTLINSVARSVKKYFSDHVATDDLEQSALIGLWKASQDYSPEYGKPFEHYARRAAKNSILNELRRAVATREDSYDAILSYVDEDTLGDPHSIIDGLIFDNPIYNDAPSDTTLSGCISKELQEIVTAAGSPLNATQKEVITLLYWEGLSMTEAAAALGMTQQNVSKVHSKAVSLLRTYMGLSMH